MSDYQFVRAERRRAKARVAIDGPTGSGKTWTALMLATVLADGGKIAVIDTEHGSASLYSDEYNFDVLNLSNYDPRHYVAAIKAAEQAGYAVIVIDSLSHAWEGEGGTLDQADQQTQRRKDKNSFAAWKDITPLQRQFVDSMLKSPCHIVATMRTKMEYAIDKDADGKTKITKVGLAPVQRQGIEYEFQVVFDMDIDHTMVVSKSRCKPIADAVVRRPTADWFVTYAKWLDSGSDTPEPLPISTPAPPPEPELPPAPAPSQRTDGLSRLSRPFAPDVLVELLEKKSVLYKGKLATVADRKKFESALSDLVEPDLADFLSFAFGAETVAGISHVMLLAGLDWLKPDVDGVPNEMALLEAQNAVQHIRNLAS